MISIYLCCILIFLGTSSSMKRETDLVRNSLDPKANKSIRQNNIDVDKKSLIEEMLTPTSNLLIETVDNISDKNELKEYLTNNIDTHIEFLSNLITKSQKPENDGYSKYPKTMNIGIGIFTNIANLKKIISIAIKMKDIVQKIEDISFLRSIIYTHVFAPVDYLMTVEMFDMVNRPGTLESRKEDLLHMVFGSDANIAEMLNDESNREKEILKQINEIKDETRKNTLIRQMTFGEIRCRQRSKNMEALMGAIGHIKEPDDDVFFYKATKKPFTSFHREISNNNCRGKHGKCPKNDPLRAKDLIGPVLAKSFYSSLRRSINLDLDLDLHLHLTYIQFSNAIIGINNLHVLKGATTFIFGDKTRIADLIKYYSQTTPNSDIVDDVALLNELRSLTENAMKIMKTLDNSNVIRQVASQIFSSIVHLSFAIINHPTAATSRLKKLFNDIIKETTDSREREHKLFDMVFGHIGCWVDKTIVPYEIPPANATQNIQYTVGKDPPRKLEECKGEHRSNNVEWDMGIVPYYIDNTIYDSVIADRIHTTMKLIEDVSCVVFKELEEPRLDENYGSPWLYITNPTNEKECVHQMQPGTEGAMIMVLGYHCIQPRHIMHSLFHVLGFQDEVTHPQRDRYIRIFWNNIQPKYRSLFKISNPSSKPQTEYDVMSIMHFHDRAFSWNGKATISSVVPGMFISPSERMSQLDEMKLRISYGHQCNKQRANRLFESCKSILLDDETEQTTTPEPGKAEDKENEENNLPDNKGNSGKPVNSEKPGNSEKPVNSEKLGNSELEKSEPDHSDSDGPDEMKKSLPSGRGRNGDVNIRITHQDNNFRPQETEAPKETNT